MTIGPGKYDDLCTMVREKTGAAGAIVIVIGGERGSGFSCQGALELTTMLPDLLETMAHQMRRDLPR